MDQQAVCRKMAQLVGLTQEEAAVWQEVCDACCQRVLARLRPGVDQESNRDRLELCAAMLAAQQVRLRLTDGAQSFRLGEVSASYGAPEDSRDAWEWIGDLLDHWGVALMGLE